MQDKKYKKCTFNVLFTIMPFFLKKLYFVLPASQNWRSAERQITQREK